MKTTVANGMCVLMDLANGLVSIPLCVLEEDTTLEQAKALYKTINPTYNFYDPWIKHAPYIRQHDSNVYNVLFKPQ